MILADLSGQLRDKLAQASLGICLSLICNMICTQSHSCARLNIVVDLQWGQGHLQQRLLQTGRASMSSYS